MPITCRGLEEHGVVLIPPSAPEYPELVEDILTRTRARAKGGPPADEDDLAFSPDGSVVLRNLGSKAIVSIAYIWDVRLHPDGRVVTHSVMPGTNPSVLLPFGLRERVIKFDRYWKMIFPGSKRLIRFEGSMLGDNTDVRPPEVDELWHGSFFGFGGHIQRAGRQPLRLTLDGVFFEDGGFAGADELGIYEQTVSAAETFLELAQLARKARQIGMSPTEFLHQVCALTGQSEGGRLPPPPPPGPHRSGSLRERERAIVGFQVLQMRTSLGDEALIEQVANWGDLPVPAFHKL
jgi:hypothetical protein